MTIKFSKDLIEFYDNHHDGCSLCGKCFADGDTAHLGYIEDGECAFLCNTCSVKLSETVVRYKWKKREYEIPEINDTLWRYMDLGKFISLISKEELYFASAESFIDPFEGARGLLKNKDKWDRYSKEYLRRAILAAPGLNLEKSDGYVESEANRLLRHMNSIGIRDRKCTFISCWHYNDIESEAMWKTYSKDITNAVAIQTTYGRLRKALNNPEIEIGKVNYIEYKSRFAPFNGAFWYKRKSFEYENEVRAIYRAEKPGIPGISIPICINELIERIFISPYASSWFFDVMISIMSSYHIDKELLQSDMALEPFY